ncbi:MAG: aminopeptidase [Flavobacteriales bacterium]|jgi:bleomycin hydrolase|nr:aminopeptidase [Flavobacteriales bacterium]MBK6883066.1 aminopeptidase [Flavobacteriales bacterium]MBK7103494.1 aminopeptidase [Flavobacteriales bacterium]MBK7481549.1 aminopeptidase [Flavobacteriales bacterium]MBK7620307.1 aminopeptidase [Flavobacteriales bacterium]
MKIRSFLLSAFAITTSLHAQDDLIKKISANKSDTVGFRFTTVVSAETTPVQDQGSSGTCWSYSTGSFLESEMIKHGGPSIHLSKIYAARKVYEEKAVNYLRMHGSLNYGDGGLGHDAVNMYGKYGAMPEEAYTGLNFGNDENEFAEMQAVLKGMLDALVKAPNDGKLTPVWRNAFNGVLDAYLGEVPEEFTYNGKTYTPKSFADNVVKLKADDYVEFISGTDAPYYTRTTLMVPDNWALQPAYNVPVEDLTAIIDNALRAGYTVAWGGDVSEPTFSWKNGVAFTTMADAEKLTKAERQELFKSPQPEPVITAEMRQNAFDNYGTTDDHGMQLTGIAQDQNGTEWYVVKNSWGDSNDYKGYLYMSKPFVQYKTTAFLVNKKGVPNGVMKKLGM